MAVDYHQDTKRISKSGLDLIARSPAHYWQAYLAPPEQRVRKKSKEMDIGTALHLLVLEPSKFNTRVVLEPDFDLRTKAGRSQMMEWSNEHGWKVALSCEEIDSVMRMRDAIFRHPLASAALTGELEVEALREWTDADTGAPCKCRFDCLNTSKGVAPDLKTTRDASPLAFAKSVANYRYHVQEAFYMDGYRTVHGADADMSFLFVAVETAAPFAVAVYELDMEAVQIGRALYKQDIRTWMRCMEANRWDAYGNDIKTLELPKWAKI